ncbi:MAG: NADP-dependent oxidoreductase [Saccharopolyspora sp.]|uniref:quinone oxidoreductase family protein n=1 Tax=Saccharopolyspora TaxID=1835 RepID=UPI00190B6B95|nr:MULTISPECIES: NADP-dependent oxidoreductase [unclassified Saccharopolyspora]MBK0865212.1 NADP-dependent oxidoreductase [Saccharopolyspora sp. HNM0986]MBQ6644573.1 NADP-dependent oxidoreductase [Saccharopolyspora sp.]
MAKAVVATGFGGPENLSVVDVDVPDPGPGQVTVEPRAIGVNPIDFKLYSGAFGEDPGKLPMRLGHELAGVVTAAGPDAHGKDGPLAVGDEVVVHPAPGAYASAVTVSAANAVSKPAEVSWQDAAGLLLAGSTAVHMLSLTGTPHGKTLLVHGVSGAVGLLAAQLALEAGSEVVGTAGESRHAALRERGITPVAYGPGLTDRVRAAAPSEVVGVVDAVGTDEAIDTSLELVDPERIVTAAAFHRADDGIKPVGGGPGADPGTEVRGNAWRRLFQLAAQGRLELPIARTFPLTEAAEAHRLSIDGHPGGKLVLLP